MFRAIVDAGLKPFQLDRDERLLKAGLPAEEVKKAAEEAATAADCVLVTHQQITSVGFPFGRYKAVLYDKAHICVHCCSHFACQVACCSNTADLFCKALTNVSNGCRCLRCSDFKKCGQNTCLHKLPCLDPCISMHIYP